MNDWPEELIKKGVRGSGCENPECKGCPELVRQILDAIRGDIVLKSDMREEKCIPNLGIPSLPHYHAQRFVTDWKRLDR